MTETEIRHFFSGYARAFTALDVGGICDHFGFPCQIVSEDKAYCFADRAAMDKDMGGFVQAYADLDFARAELIAFRFEELSPAFGQAHIGWRLVTRAERVMVEFHSTYVLRLNRARPMIIAILGHDEDSQWRAVRTAIG